MNSFRFYLEKIFINEMDEEDDWEYKLNDYLSKNGYTEDYIQDMNMAFSYTQKKIIYKYLFIKKYKLLDIQKISIDHVDEYMNLNYNKSLKKVMASKNTFNGYKYIFRCF